MANVRSEQRRRELTDAAVQVILEEGPSAVTARKIADRAGAPLGIVHYTFRDMDELMQLANTEVLNSIARAVQNVRTDRGVSEFVGDFLKSYVRFILANPDETLAFFETFVSLLRPERANSAVVDGRKFLVDRLAEAEKHDARPSNIPLSQLATLITMIVDGLSLIHLARRDQRQTSRDVKHLIAALQHLV